MKNPPQGSGVSGAVSSVSNSDGTLTISPSTGAVVASLALGHANTWLATQTLTPASGSAIVLKSAAATSGTTLVNSPQQDFLGAYWNGSASVPFGFRIYSDMVNTNPHAILSFNLNNNGILTEIFHASSDGGINLLSTTQLFNRPIQTSSLAASYSTTSTTAVSTGIGITVTPHGTHVELRFTGLAQTLTAVATVRVSLYRSTTSIPAQGSGINAGDTELIDQEITPPLAATNEPVSIAYIDKGLVQTTTYYYYVTIETSSAADAAQLTAINGNTNNLIGEAV